jgi:amino acid permease
LIFDFLFLIIGFVLSWYVFGRKIEEILRKRLSIVFLVISWFAYKLLYRATLINHKNTQIDALINGLTVGLIALLALWGIVLLIRIIKNK